MRLLLAGSNDDRLAADRWDQWDVSTARTRIARPITAAAVRPSSQPVERTLRSLIHSIRATLANP